jgi:beta-phosphoglucomutase-like phosphatase (HAD superfamily)
MFDIDGTLTASDRVDTECYVQAMSEHLGVAIDSDWSRYRHITDSGIAAELFEMHDRPTQGIAIVQRRFVELIERALQTNPGSCAQVAGAADFLTRVRRSPGWLVGLATGGWEGSAKAKLRQAGIEIEGLALRRPTTPRRGSTS